jgi:hypothetical protein
MIFHIFASNYEKLEINSIEWNIIPNKINKLNLKF